MVLVHGLDKTEELHTEHTNNVEEADSPPPSGRGGVTSAEPDPAPTPQSSPMSDPHILHRPLTRSQTGRVPKRRRRDETPPAPEVRRKPPAPRKKTKQPVRLDSDPGDLDAREEGSAAASPPERDSPSASVASADMSSPGAPLTFVDGSSSSAGKPVDRCGPRQRVVLPVPVPNLTKKSRGRRVPTKPVNSGDQNETRLYVCKVESCGKCFHRGEHLKRHIRSIHTHEKPFKCSYPSCDKNFNRHDNLLQHLKIHKAPEVLRPSYAKAKDEPKPESQRSSPSPTPPQSPQRLYIHTSAGETYQTSTTQSRIAAFHQRSSFVTYPYSSPERMSIATGMAVSSLRTEIPHSPPTRKHEPPAHQRHLRAD